MAAHTIPTHAACAIHRRSRTPGRLAVLGLAAAVLFSVSPVASARSVGISVLDADYSTRVNVRQGRVVAGELVVTLTSRTTLSPWPIDDELRASRLLFAKAHADVFSISAETSATDPQVPSESAGSHAEMTLRFSTLADELAPLSLKFAGYGQAIYSGGLVSLYDVTADSFLFNYSWDCCSFSSGNVPWIWNASHGGASPYTASIAVEPMLLASHVYELTMGASTNAQDDAQRVTIDLSGLQVAPVPEPSTYAMLLMGFGLVGLSTRRCRGPRG